jgi:general secretion pathway protein G
MQKSKSGFTIVELLIVIVVIGVLAAITIVAYNGIQDRARSSTLQNDLVNAKKKLLLYQTEQGKFPSTFALIGNVGISASKSVYDTTGNNFYYCYNTTNDQFGLAARTISNTAAYQITSSSSLQKLSGVSGDTVCQAIGLTAWNDPNGYISNGYTNGGGWLSWVNG